MPSEPTAATVEAAERRILEKWYATASVGARLAYWTARAKDLRHG
jgi:hypothetical protein